MAKNFTQLRNGMSAKARAVSAAVWWKKCRSTNFAKPVN